MGNRDSKGRFKKGSNGNPKGNNQFTSVVPMIEALTAVGKEKRRISGLWLREKRGHPIPS